MQQAEARKAETTAPSMVAMDHLREGAGARTFERSVPDSAPMLGLDGAQGRGGNQDDKTIVHGSPAITYFRKC
jgi:hypothetical protein